MKKLALLSSLILINCLLDSCSSNSNATCFNLDIIDVKNFTLDSFVVLNTGDTTAVNDYAIQLDAESMSETCFIDYSFGGSLLAEQPIIRFTNKVTNISIKSNADLSATYPAESELKDLFIPISITLNCLNNASDTSTCVMDYFDYDFVTLEETVNEVISQNIFFGDENDKNLFSLNIEETIISNNHEFTIQFDFENGASTELKTEQVVLN